MKCEICGDNDPRLMMILPIHRKGGNLCTMACGKCARESTAFCKKHDRIHQGFIDGSTACLACVEELVENYSLRAPAIAEKLLAVLPKSEMEDLKEAAETSSHLTGSPRDISILRFVASKAARQNKPVGEVLLNMAQEKSARAVLW